MNRLQQAIDRLGAELVTCTDACAGINRNQVEGILPRGLYLDRPTARGKGCVVVGLNPGQCKQRERDFFVASKRTYDGVKEFYSISRFAYYTKTRNLIAQLELDGPILWTNLAKCETAPGRDELPHIQTMRHCGARFLRRELAHTPNDWPVLALGRDAFSPLAYLLPERVVIGIPHPTGGARDFVKLFVNRELRTELKDCVAIAISSAEPLAMWLGSGKDAAEEIVGREWRLRLS